MGEPPILEYARSILSAESRAIEAIRLDAAFEKTVQRILALKGAIVVSGMGKAGLVAQKISATFASTGTPSLYLHPAEAAHGDIGRVRHEDLLLVLSNSGETEEILRMLPVIRRIGAAVVSVTADRGSALGSQSDVVISFGKIEEACPIGMSPSASTAVMMALGDALALTVFKQRGLGPEEFARFHPGGALGKKMLTVRQIMRTGEAQAVVKEETSMQQALMEITRARAGAVCVVNGAGALAGIFTDGDLRRCLGGGTESLSRPIKEVMTRAPIRITPDRLATEGARMLHEKQIDELPVVDADGTLVGLLDVQDLLKIGLV